MASRALATAFVNIVPGTKEMEDYLKGKLQKDVSDSGDGAGKGFGSKFSGGLKTAMAGVGAAFAIGTVANFAGDLLNAAEEGQRVDNAMKNVATSMGLFGGETDKVVGRLQAFATEQMKLTGTDDDVIKGAQTKLLTFKDLADSADTAGGAFDRATTLSMDMAAVFGGDASTQAVALGKALQDPEKGITALSRVGVQFTDDQKKMIAGMVEAGDTAGAQEIILKELETQVGGTAAASATAGDKMRASFEDTTQALGTLLLPAFDGLASLLNTTVIPAFQWMIDNPSIMIPVLAGLGTVLLAVLAPAIWAAVTATWAFTVALLANPLTWVVIAVAALVAGIVALAMNWDIITAWIETTWTGFINWIGPEFDKLGAWWNGLWEGIKKFGEDTWNNIVSWFNGAVQWLVDIFLNWTLLGQIIKNWDDITAAFSGAWNGIVAWFDGAIKTFVRGWEKSWSGMGKFIEDTFNNIVGFVKAPLNSIIGLINSAIAGINSIKIDIPDWVPLIGGKTLGFNIPKIPKLAAGGFVDSPTTALIGEAGPEVVTPLKDFERMMGMDKPASDRPIYADGIGLLGWIREEAAGQATLVFNTELGRLSRGAR